MQPVVGARMGYTRHGKQDGVERFMRHYFLIAREVVRLTRILEPGILPRRVGSSGHRRGKPTRPWWNPVFLLAEGKLLPIGGRDFDAEPIQMLRILQVARDRGLELHPLALRSMVQNERRAIELRGDPKAAGHFTWTDVRPRARVPPRRTPFGPASRRRAAGCRCLNETGFLGRFHPRLGAHRRADAVRHLSHLHRR